MVKPFDNLYVDLENALKLADRNHRGPERYLRGLELIRERIGKLRVQGAKFIREGEREIEFFRHVWPAFYSRLLLYIRLHEMELGRLTMPADDWPALIGKEEAKVVEFFRANRDFWRYYYTGARGIDEQFTRAYSRGRIFEPLSLVMDQEGATVASYRAAWCIAMSDYGTWLREQRASLTVGGGTAADLGYSFGSTDADLAELLFGLQAAGAIRYQGQPADISRLQKWAKLALGREVANIYDRGRLLRNRKKEKLAFIKKIANALEKIWDQAEGKFE
jgi:hypothetical protein